MRQFNAPVVIHEAIAPNWMHLAFEWPLDLPAPQAGQFFTVLPAMVELGAGTILRRPLAFAGFEPAEWKNRASAATGSAIAHSIYQVRGPGTRRWHSRPRQFHRCHCSSGQTAFPAASGGEAMIAGGGIGIGPMFFLAASLSQEDLQPGNPEFQLVLGFRSTSLIPLRAASADDSPMASLWRRLLSHAFFATDDGSEGFRGTVVDALSFLKEKEASPRDWHIYGCGPGRCCIPGEVRRDAPHRRALFSPSSGWPAESAPARVVLPPRRAIFCACAPTAPLRSESNHWEASLQ